MAVPADSFNRKVRKVFAEYAKYNSKRLFFFVCFAVSFHHTFSQTVSVQLKDKFSGAPVEYAFVIAREVNGDTEVKQLSDAKGVVQFNLSYPIAIEVSSLGYRNTADTLREGNTHTIHLSPDYFQLDQVVVTGQFRAQAADKSIYKIDVIDARQIHLKAANNLGDLLKTEQGFQFRSEGVLGDFIRIRGLSGEYIKILIDGMPVTGRVADRIDLGQLTLQQVDHIEIVEGPMSVIYGSNAIAGAINIITRDYPGKRLQVSADAYYETVGTYNLNVALAVRQNRHTISATGSRNFFSGWGPQDTSRYKAWKPKLQYMAGLGYQYNFRELKVKVNSDYLIEELRDPDSLSLANLYEKALDGHHFTTRWNNRASVVNTFTDDFVLNLQAGYSYYRKKKITYVNDLVNLKKSISQNPDLHDTTVFHMASARGFVSNIPGRKFEYQTGFDLNHESGNGKRTGGTRMITDLSGFINLIYRPVKEISLQPGLRVMYNSNYRAPLVYGMSLKYSLPAFNLRASYAKGFRAPSLKQLYLQFIDNNHEIYGNPGLQAETADNASLALGYNFIKDRHAVDLELGMFYNSIHNAIQLAISTDRPGWGMYFNVAGKNYVTQGAEARIRYRFSPGLMLGSGIITTARMRLDSSGDYAWSTDFVSSLSYLFARPKLQVALFYKYSDEYLEFAGNYNADGQLEGIAQQFIAGYHTLDLTLSKSLFRERLSLSTGVKNIFDVTLVNSLGNITIHGSNNGEALAGYGRTFFIKLGYRFDK